MTTTTPESRGQIAYTAYGRAVGFVDKRGDPIPAYFELSKKERAAWRAAAGVIWDLATTGRATL